MKKVFLLVAFTGIVGAASAASFVSLTKTAIVEFRGDDKKKEEKKACCKKDGKDEKGKTCAEGEKKSCCKKGGEKTAAIAPATPAPAPTK